MICYEHCKDPALWERCTGKPWCHDIKLEYIVISCRVWLIMGGVIIFSYLGGLCTHITARNVRLFCMAHVTIIHVGYDVFLVCVFVLVSSCNSVLLMWGVHFLSIRGISAQILMPLMCYTYRKGVSGSHGAIITCGLWWLSVCVFVLGGVKIFSYFVKYAFISLRELCTHVFIAHGMCYRECKEPTSWKICIREQWCLLQHAVISCISASCFFWEELTYFHT